MLGAKAPFLLKTIKTTGLSFDQLFFFFIHCVFRGLMDCMCVRVCVQACVQQVEGFLRGCYNCFCMHMYG